MSKRSCPYSWLSTDYGLMSFGVCHGSLTFYKLGILPCSIKIDFNPFLLGFIHIILCGDTASTLECYVKCYPFPYQMPRVIEVVFHNARVKSMSKRQNGFDFSVIIGYRVSTVTNRTFGNVRNTYTCK